MVVMVVVVVVVVVVVAVVVVVVAIVVVIVVVEGGRTIARCRPRATPPTFGNTHPHHGQPRVCPS